VVNIILKDDLEGLSVGGRRGISSRGDGQRYGGDLSFGTSFAGGNGHFIAGVEYLTDKGVPDRNSRRNLGSAGIVRIAPGTTDLRTQLVRDVNYGNQTADGLITTGILAGQVFNQDGTLRPFRAGSHGWQRLRRPDGRRRGWYRLV
jgi:iron complex outermembrane receptor protein